MNLKRTEVVNLASIAIIFVVHFTSVNSNSCYEETAEVNKAQVAFLIDRYGHPGIKQGFQSLASAFPSTIDAVGEKEVAVVSYGLFNIATRQADACFRVEMSFSSDWAAVSDVIGSMEAPQAVIGQNSPISAVALAAANNQLGWDFGARSAKGKFIRRLIVFASTRDSIVKTNSTNELVGDGSDTCVRRDPLDYGSVRWILRENNIAVLALLNSESLKRLYDLHFYAIGIPYCSAVYDEVDQFQSKLAESINRCLRALEVCPSG